MAKLVEYDERSIDNNSDGRLLMEVIACMEAINTLPIHESTNTDTDCEFKGFEKTFWGKQKLVAYCKLSIIEDLKLEVTLPAGTTNIPPYVDVAVGFTLAESGALYIPFYKIGEKEKIILSYYWLMEAIKISLSVHQSREMGLLDLTGMNKTLNLLIVKTMLEKLKYEVTTYE